MFKSPSPEPDDALYRLKEKVNYMQYESKSFLIGQVLTLCDASFFDPEQRKAFKDMIRDIFWPSPREVLSTQMDKLFAQFAVKFKGQVIEPKAWMDKDIDNQKYMNSAENFFPDVQGK